MSARFAVVGCGIQGTAAAYDLLRFSSAPVTLADLDEARVGRTADRLAALDASFQRRVSRETLDVNDPGAVAGFLWRHDVVVSALPYRLHPLLEGPAITHGKAVVDMGSDTDDVLALLARHGEAQASGATIVTDCGLAPGLVNAFAAALIERHPEVRHVRTYCGGLPKYPRPPLNYALRFSLESLIGEYEDDAFELCHGEVVRAEPLTDLEQVAFPGIGILEAFVTSGGSGTAPYTFRERLDGYAYKTLRYPGHCQAMRLLRDLGFWDRTEIAPNLTARAATVAVLERSLSDDDGEDVALVLVSVTLPDGRVTTLRLNEARDLATGFTAMERLTGFSTAIVAHAVAEGRVPAGVVPCEVAMKGEAFIAELARRDISPVASDA